MRFFRAVTTLKREKAPDERRNRGALAGCESKI